MGSNASERSSTTTELTQSSELGFGSADSKVNTVSRRVKIAHRKGSIDVDCVLSMPMSTGLEEGLAVEKCSVSRTARRLFEGRVFYYC